MQRFNTAELKKEEIYGIPNQEGLPLLRLRPQKQFSSAQVGSLHACNASERMLILLLERLGLTAVFTRFSILFYNKLNLCT